MKENIMTLVQDYDPGYEQSKRLFRRLLAACATKQVEVMIPLFSPTINFLAGSFRDPIIGIVSLRKYFMSMVQKFDSLEYKIHGMYQIPSHAEQHFSILWSGTYIETKHRYKMEFLCGTYFMMDDGKISSLINMRDEKSFIKSSYVVVTGD